MMKCCLFRYGLSGVLSVPIDFFGLFGKASRLKRIIKMKKLIGIRSKKRWIFFRQASAILILMEQWSLPIRRYISFFRILAHKDLQEFSELRDALHTSIQNGVIRLAGKKDTYIFPDGRYGIIGKMKSETEMVRFI